MINIIRDSREKKNYFTFSLYNDVCVTCKKLDTGDYSIHGYESKITIDRKHNCSELYTNLVSDWTRFKKEIIRMDNFDESYILCSFPEYRIDIFPRESGIPQYRQEKVKNKGSFLRKQIREIKEQFKVLFIFTDDKFQAEDVAYSILKEYYDNQSISPSP